ncbi:MFS transporter [Modestobacter sp. NPDC049651]|uniref:MFS transporter n=1 Tax=unclassified Modestobacter TaxID=2643866 RepID=UPI0034075959
MSSTLAVPDQVAAAPTQPTAPAAPRRRLPPRGALWLLASLVVSFLASSSAPTPLYAVYQAEWGFSAITTTVVFGVYALAVLLALLTLGRLSDHVGRRPVLLAAIGGQLVALAVFATAGGVPELLLGRVLQGLATGAAVGALGAAMLDVDRDRGTLANTVAPGIGTALGALSSGLLVQYLPAPTHLVYLVLAAVFLLQGLGLLLVPETVGRVRGALASLAPELGLPRALRGPVLIAAPVLVAVWALAGFYASLAPGLLRELTGSGSVVLGGSGLAVLAGVGAAAVYALRTASAGRVMVIGAVALVGGVGLTLVALPLGSVALFYAGTAVAGAGFGSGFQGAVRTVVPLAAPHERSGVLSLLFVVSYLGLGAPAVVAGFLVVHVNGLLATAGEYGGFVALLGLAALAGLLGTAVRQSGRRVLR